VNVRIRIVHALGESRDRSVVDELLPLTTDPDHLVRRVTIEALGQIGEEHPDVLGLVSSALDAGTKDRWRSVRETAARVRARLVERTDDTE
jgi:HEAT repeat protein